MGRGKGASRRRRTPQGPAPAGSSYSLGLEGQERDGDKRAGDHLGAQVEDGSAVSGQLPGCTAGASSETIYLGANGE